MYQMFITKSVIENAASGCLSNYTNALYSPDVRRGIRLAFRALSEAAPIDTELSWLFDAAAKSIPVSRRLSKYQNLPLELHERFGAFK